MNQEQTQDTEKKNKRVHKLPQRLNKGERTKAGIRFGYKLFNQILDIAESSRMTFSDAARLLMHIGHEQYEINQIAGIDTAAKRKQDVAKRTAEAQALAARREEAKQRRSSRGKQDTAQAVTPLLFGIDTED